MGLILTKMKMNHTGKPKTVTHCYLQRVIEIIYSKLFQVSG